MQPPPAAALGPSATSQQQHGQPQSHHQQQIPTNLAAGVGAFNPFAGLTGATYAGRAPLPNASLFGPDRTRPTGEMFLIHVAGNQLPPSPEQMQEMMAQVSSFYWISTDID